MKLLIAVIVLCLILGAGLVAGGIGILFGLGWAMIACGIFLLMAAGILRLGVTVDG